MTARGEGRREAPRGLPRAAPSVAALRSALRRRLYARARLLDDEDLARPAVVFAPHPDDEVLGCGGVIAQKVRRGAEVTVVYVTDGSRARRSLMAEEEFAALRRAESLEASRILGVPAVHVVQWRLDATLRERPAAAREQVAALLAHTRPAQVFLPHAGDPPEDHRAVHALVRAAVRAQPRALTMLEYPVWLWAHWPWVEVPARPRRTLPRRLAAGAAAARRLWATCRWAGDIRGVLEVKREALAAHRSQMERLVPSPDWHTLADVSHGTFLECFFQPYELFYRYEHRAPG